MANTTLSNLDDATALDYTELINIVQGGELVKGDLASVFNIPDVESGSFEADVYGLDAPMSVSINYSRFGSIIALDIPAINGTSPVVSSGAFFFIYNIPPELLPTGSVRMVSCPARFYDAANITLVTALLKYSATISTVDYDNGIYFYSEDINWSYTGNYRGTEDRFQLIYNIL